MLTVIDYRFTQSLLYQKNVYAFSFPDTPIGSASSWSRGHRPVFSASQQLRTIAAQPLHDGRFSVDSLPIYNR
jgi:hypothetical protein